MTCTLAEWFAVLPGNGSAAQRATARFEATDPGVQILARHEGRPWIIGRSTRPLLAVHAAGVSAALLGTHECGEQELSDALTPADPVGTIAALMRGAGSYHAVLATGNSTWVCGDVAGMRPVFRAQVGGAVVFGDHARLLAEAAGTVRIDPSHLVMHLLGPVPPLALAESGSSPYEGVRVVPPGNVGYVEDGRGVAVRRWWSVPDDERALPEAAPVLRDALRRAVAVRSRGEPLVGCELSGGADSTALSALAYEEVGERLANFTRAPADPANDDTDWARLVAASQPGASHETFEVGAVPAQFAGMDAPFALDAPSPSAASPLRSAFWWRHAAGAGARTLLSGKGGDELTLTALPYLSYTRRRDRRTARQHVKGWAALWGSSARQVQSQAVAPESYAAWLAGCLTRQDESFGWEAGPHVPPWLTGAARTALADAVSTAAAAVEPLHDRPHQHTTMAAIRALARWNRLQADAAGPFGIRLGYPYADQQVIEAALSARAEARTSPYQNKPLLTAAMRGIVPAACLARRTKGGYSTDTVTAAAAMRQTFARLLDADCRLASYGLIDAERLRAALTGWDRADERTDLLLHLTIMCEIWARTADNHPLPTLDSPAEARC
ncbi:asparagine synthase-related protein [Streptomyces sp. Edi2]|uniref:asparagine synthase-related protein n=1 Tax=Streptomyces sp. Edi2 TaxID=3162528 RepID=UPI00330690AE